MAAARAALVWAARDSCAALAAMASALPAASAACTDQPASQPPNAELAIWHATYTGQQACKCDRAQQCGLQYCQGRLRLPEKGCSVQHQLEQITTL